MKSMCSRRHGVRNAIADAQPRSPRKANFETHRLSCLACISPESLSRIPAEVLSLGMGVASEDSRACVLDFASAHGHYIELSAGYRRARRGPRRSEDFLVPDSGGRLEALQLPER